MTGRMAIAQCGSAGENKLISADGRSTRVSKGIILSWYVHVVERQDRRRNAIIT